VQLRKLIVLGNLNSHSLGTILSPVPIFVDVTGEATTVCLISLPYFFLCNTSASIWTNSIALKTATVHSSKMLEHLTVAQRRSLLDKQFP